MTDEIQYASPEQRSKNKKYRSVYKRGGSQRVRKENSNTMQDERVCQSKPGRKSVNS